MDAYSLRRNNLHLKTKNFNLKKKINFSVIIYWERIYSQRKCVVKMRILVHVCQIKGYDVDSQIHIYWIILIWIGNKEAVCRNVHVYSLKKRFSNCKHNNKDYFSCTLFKLGKLNDSTRSEHTNQN